MAPSGYTFASVRPAFETKKECEAAAPGEAARWATFMRTKPKIAKVEYRPASPTSVSVFREGLSESEEVEFRCMPDGVTCAKHHQRGEAGSPAVHRDFLQHLPRRPLRRAPRRPLPRCAGRACRRAVTAPSCRWCQTPPDVEERCMDKVGRPLDHSSRRY